MDTQDTVSSRLERVKPRAANLVILHSNDEKFWTPLLPENVPEWVKDPDTVGMMVAGQMVTDTEIPNCGWYRAEVLEAPKIKVANRVDQVRG